jgi:circadian clock protein KaiC
MNTAKRLSTGIQGLDQVLQGGLIEGRAYLVRGGPGAGKTTLGLHFLVEGARQGEKVLFITLGETEAQIRANAEGLGIDLHGVGFLDLSPQSEFFTSEEVYDIFSAAEVEREPTMEKIINAVEQHRPRRVFIDSMTQFRYLATDAFQYRKQALSFFRFLAEKGATVLFTSEGSAEAPDEDLQFLADGVINIETDNLRTVRVSKFRGSDFASGRHIIRIGQGGMQIFPWIPPAHSEWESSLEKIPSGVPELAAFEFIFKTLIKFTCFHFS